MKFNIKKINILKIGIVIFIFELIIYFSINYPFKPDNIQNVLSDLISMSSILSGILTTYLISKVFQLINQRQEKKREIISGFIELSNLHMILVKIWFKNKSNWDNSEDLKKIMMKYKKLNFCYDMIINKKKYADNSLLKRFSNELKSINGAKLMYVYTYFEFISLIGQKWRYDDIPKQGYFEYTIEDLINLKDALVKLYLIANYNYKLLELAEVIDFELKIEDHLVDYINKLNEFRYPYVKLIDKNIVSILSHKYSYYFLPKLIKLMKSMEIFVPDSLKRLSYFLIFLFSSGIIIPFILKLISIPMSILFSIITAVIIFILFEFIFFAYSFYRVLNNELKITF
ncbi:MAG: hypothetical protein JXJ22_06335 [Bacteroidales bacterium]|nr:hypothetical protein [Bacteroidales bacterium]